MVYGNEKKYLINTIKQNFFSSAGNFVNKFEDKIKKITKAKYAIAVVNCTEAIHITLKACGIKRGDEVLVPSLTFIETVNPITYLGAIPISKERVLMILALIVKNLRNIYQRLL